ncbi:MAG TPA: hypothetical protein PK029_02440, partial [Bacteroidales bacterium]|nr:hypothetical protein [Bacteroidales bacterium]
MDFTISQLGKCTVRTPLQLSKTKNDGIYDYIEDTERILFSNSLKIVAQECAHDVIPDSFEKPGPKEFLYFEPAKT